MKEFDITSEDLDIIMPIFRRLIPDEGKVWIFGSRANGKAKPFSDVDFALDLGKKLTIEEYTELKNAFEDSLLPYKVDIIDLESVNENFKELISQEKKLFFMAKK